MVSPPANVTGFGSMPEAGFFAKALTAEKPPPHWSAPLLGLWHAARGDWEKAHDCVRLDETAEAAWVHAHLR